jgi:hypothetical protein
MKRSSGGGSARRPDESTAKLEKQDLWDELQKRAAGNEPFAPLEVSQAIGAPEGAVATALLTLAYERMVERIDTNRYRSGWVAQVSQADFNRALGTKLDPKRQQDWLEIERLKKNNDEMRRRLLEAAAERDRYLALLRQHGIDPSPPGPSSGGDPPVSPSAQG